MPKLEWIQYCVCHPIKRDWYVALDNIDLTVEPGEFVLITGPSGCGKTSLLRSAIGFAQHSSGQMLIDGQDAAGLRPGEENIGYVSQEYSLYPSMTVYENIAYPLTVRKMPLHELDKRVRAAAAQVGLGAFLTRKPRQLSGGQQQRLALARALVKSPSLLLLDEPFSNLPERTKEDLYAAVGAYHESSGATVLLVTHNADEAMPLADRVVEMSEGAVARVYKPGPNAGKGELG